MAEKNKSVPVYLSQNELGFLTKMLNEEIIPINRAEQNMRFRFLKRLRKKLKKHLKTGSFKYAYNAVVFVKG